MTSSGSEQKNVEASKWIGRIRSGDYDAFADMTRAYYRGLLDYAAGITRSIAVAEDIVQDVLLYVWENRSTWYPRVSAKAYLFRAVRNRSLNFRRDQITRRQVTERISESHQDGRSVEPSVEYQALLREYHAALAELPERRRMVFSLSRFYGLTYSEIAAVMDISVNTVRSQMADAIKYLRQRLADQVER